MTTTARLSRVAQHVLTFALNFAHGGLVMAGVIVVGLIGYQAMRFGADGLQLRNMFASPVTNGSTELALLDVAYENESAGRGDVLSSGFMRVTSAIAKRYRISPVVLQSLVKAAEHEGHNNGIDPLLILAVVTVESGFNPYAESVMGAQGLMQVIPKFHADKISTEKGATALFDPVENIRVGTIILKEYLRTTGSVENALQVYCGAAGDGDMSYSTKVIQEYERLRQIYGSKPVERAASAGAAPVTAG